MPRLFKASIIGYRRREVDEAVELLGQTVDAMKARLAETERDLDARRQDLRRKASELDELDEVATRLAEIVVERERELRTARAALDRERRRVSELLAAPVRSLKAQPAIPQDGATSAPGVRLVEDPPATAEAERAYSYSSWRRSQNSDSPSSWRPSGARSSSP